MPNPSLQQAARRVATFARPMAALLTSLLLTGCSLVNAVVPQVATLIAPTAVPATRTPRATRTARPATATVQATRPRPTRTPLPATITPEPVDATEEPTVKSGTPTPEAAADQLSGLTGSTAVFDEETEADGWKRYSSADEGFAISLPDSWQRIDVDNEEVLMEGLRAIDPSLVETLGERLHSQLGGAMRFFALDSGNARAGSLAANINVLRQPLAERLDLETVIRQAVRGLQSIDTIQGEIKSETIKLRNGEAGMLTYTLNVSGANGKSVPTVIRQYIIGTDSHLLVITFGVSEDQAGEYAATFDDIASRFEVLP